MSGFTRGGVEYVRDGRPGRLATVDASGRPRVVPVGFRYNPALGAVDLRGRNPGPSKKFRGVGKTGRVASVMDNALRGAPRWARGVEVRGRAEASAGDTGSEGELIRTLPERSVVRGIDPDAGSPSARSIPG